MFKQHQTTIQDACRDSVFVFSHVGLLVILSARQPFYTVATQFDDVLKGEGNEHLFDWKYDAWMIMQAEAAARKAKLDAIYADTNLHDDAKATEMLAEVGMWHGFGLVKGGFFIQLVYGLSGCIDTRNLDYFNLDARDFNASKIKAKRIETRRRHATAYHRVIRSLGGTELLWNVWCDYMAETSSRFSDGWDVSAEHCRILRLPTGERPTCDDIPF